MQIDNLLLLLSECRIADSKRVLSEHNNVGHQGQKLGTLGIPPTYQGWVRAVVPDLDVNPSSAYSYGRVLLNFVQTLA
jgi:hypothetical protein